MFIMYIFWALFRVLPVRNRLGDVSNETASVDGHDDSSSIEASDNEGSNSAVDATHTPDSDFDSVKQSRKATFFGRFTTNINIFRDVMQLTLTVLSGSAILALVRPSNDWTPGDYDFYCSNQGYK